MKGCAWTLIETRGGLERAGLESSFGLKGARVGPFPELGGVFLSRSELGPAPIGAIAQIPARTPQRSSPARSVAHDQLQLLFLYYSYSSSYYNYYHYTNTIVLYPFYNYCCNCCFNFFYPQLPGPLIDAALRALAAPALAGGGGIAAEESGPLDLGKVGVCVFCARACACVVRPPFFSISNFKSFLNTQSRETI